jgi:hypothetical protein
MEALPNDTDNEDINDTNGDSDDGSNVHCWVLIKKGQRGMVQDIYIEPTTARIYD